MYIFPFLLVCFVLDYGFLACSVCKWTPAPFLQPSVQCGYFTSGQSPMQSWYFGLCLFATIKQSSQHQRGKGGLVHKEKILLAFVRDSLRTIAARVKAERYRNRIDIEWYNSAVHFHNHNINATHKHN